MALFCCVLGCAHASAPPLNINDIRAALDAAPGTVIKTEAALKLNQEVPGNADAPTLAKYYWERGRAAGELGLRVQEREELLLAARYAVGIKNKTLSEDWILNELASAEASTRNLLDAARLRERVLELNQNDRKSNTGQILGAYRNLIKLYVELGERDKARKALAEAEWTLESKRNSRGYELNQHAWPAQIAEARAELLESEGRYAEAEPLRRQALVNRRLELQDSRERRELGKGKPGSDYLSYRSIAGTERRLAKNLVKQQRLSEAEAVMRKRVFAVIHDHGRYYPGTGDELKILGDILYQQGRYSEARELAEIVLEIYTKAGFAEESQHFTGARRSHAQALTAEGRYSDALAEFARIQQGLAHDPSLLVLLGRGDLDWAYALVRTGQTNQALAMLDGLLRDARNRFGDAHYDTAEAQGFLGMAQAAAGQQTAALKNFSQALPVLIASMETTNGTTRSALHLWRLNQIGEAYIELLALLHARGTQATPGIDAVAESFMIADVVRGSSVLKALSSSAARSASAANPRLAELVRREQELSQRLQATQDRIVQLIQVSSDQRSEVALTNLRREAKQMASERHQLFDDIVRESPQLAQLISPKPTQLRGVQDALAAGEVLISMYVGANQTFVWAVPKKGSAAFISVALGEAQIAARVKQLRKSVDSSAASLDELPAFDVVAANDLYAHLLRPIERSWRQGDTLLIVPHRALAQLPFALLPTEHTPLPKDRTLLFDAYRQLPWLVRQVAIVQLPTANALIALRALPPGDPQRRAFAGFGDPLFNDLQLAEFKRATATPIQLAAAGNPVLRGSNLPRRNLQVAQVSDNTGAGMLTDLVANSSLLRHVPRLPDTAQEIHEVAAALHADEAQDVFLELQASENRVKSTRLDNRRIVMFATHGLVPGELNGLNQPALALTSPALLQESGDGLLTMEEVLGLKLNADWVVLSACNTAAGEGNGGEAFSGLARAFFYAGSRAMLVTQWPVETTSARMLTTDLFRKQAAWPKLTRAQALRETMVDMIDGPGYVESGKSIYAYAHPLFWAPFALVGDGGR